MKKKKNLRKIHVFFPLSIVEKDKHAITDNPFETYGKRKVHLGLGSAPIFPNPHKDGCRW